ncbi:hypothetical protein DERP_008315 [Dermatophagoides pteronyssinus]|uniref:Uncharacterized protein n=1 Tax=Dermatophagoides pteronyssinus TaxID=6956 RepID=A0ABQ8J649_DERPT|nr:hypothetical protein DERP_008315 [Dermatophagoides pteronyssinus]
MTGRSKSAFATLLPSITIERNSIELLFPLELFRLFELVEFPFLLILFDAGDTADVAAVDDDDDDPITGLDKVLPTVDLPPPLLDELQFNKIDDEIEYPSVTYSEYSCDNVSDDVRSISACCC